MFGATSQKAHSVKWVKRALLTLKFALMDWSFGALVKVSTQRFDLIFSKLGQLIVLKVCSNQRNEYQHGRLRNKIHRTGSFESELV